MSIQALAQSEPGIPTLAKATLLSSPAAQQPDQQRVKGSSLTTLQIPFIANESQVDPKVSYYASTFAGTVYVTRDGKIVYSLPSYGKDSPRGARKKILSSWTLTETPVGGRPQPRGEGLTKTQASFFIGSDPARWKTGVATYDSVTLGEVWPGVDVTLRAYGRNTEKLFAVRPGANASRIRMRVVGARSLRVNLAGALVATTGLGEVTFTPPAAYQECAETRREIEVAYQVRGNGYGFRLGSYDPRLAVVIDPLIQATYLGGSGEDALHALAIHPTSGEVYVAGGTASTDFPGTSGGAQPAPGANGDAFVARLNATLTTLIQATYLGGGGDDFAYDLAIHPSSGDVYVTGGTYSTNFPGTSGGARPASGGGGDAFVARLNASLTTMIQATYLSGGGSDHTTAAAIHPTSGELYASGNTNWKFFWERN